MSITFSDADYKQTLTRSEQEWIELGEQNALSLFHEMAKRVPAYKDFLQKNEVDPGKIKTIENLQTLPLLTKKNYLEAYPMEQLFWDGSFDGIHEISSTSGTTGQPFYWGLGEGVEYSSKWQIDFIMRHAFDIAHKRTLVVNCLALGTWIAGTMMNDTILGFSRQGYPVTLTSPGLNKQEAATSVKKLMPFFEQIIICGYAPYIKDIIEESTLEGVDWRKANLGIYTGGENINETWRDYMAEKLGIERRRISNIYGSTENGFMGFETDLSIGLRKAFEENPELRRSVYDQERQPSLIQHNPVNHYIEEIAGELVFTRDHGVPLVRFNTGDAGGLLSYQKVADLYEQTGGKVPENQPKFPFIYLFGRSLLTNTIYGLNLYPENIQRGIEDPRIRERLSGKFVCATGYTETMDQQLEVELELAPGDTELDADFSALAREVIVERISEQNSEYRELVDKVGEKAYPVLSFLPFGDPQFVSGKKQVTKKKVA